MLLGALECDSPRAFERVADSPLVRGACNVVCKDSDIVKIARVALAQCDCYRCSVASSPRDAMRYQYCFSDRLKAAYLYEEPATTTAGTEVNATCAPCARTQTRSDKVAMRKRVIPIVACEMNGTKSKISNVV